MPHGNLCRLHLHTQLLEARFIELDSGTLRGYQLHTCRHIRYALLAGSQLRREPRGTIHENCKTVALMLERREAVNFRLPLGVMPCVIASRKFCQFQPERLEAGISLHQLRLHLRELGKRRLDPREPALQALHLRLTRATRFVCVRHGLRCSGQLLQAILEIVAIHLNRLQLLVEHLEHTGKVVAQRACAGGTRAFRSEVSNLVALLLEFAPLSKQRVSPGFRLLPVAHPGSSQLFRGNLRRSQRLTSNIELLQRLELQLRCTLQLLQALPQAAAVSAYLRNGLFQGLTTPLLACHPVHQSQFLPERREGREGHRQLCLARDRELSLLQLSPQPLRLPPCTRELALEQRTVRIELPNAFTIL